MIIEDLTSKQLLAKHYKFADTKGGEYTKAEFEIFKTELKLMDTGESYPMDTDLGVSGPYKVLQQDGNLY